MRPCKGLRRDDFEKLRVNADMVAERKRAARYQDMPPDKTLALVAEMDFVEPGASGPLAYVCPMHPEVVSDQVGKCPKCGMKLMPQAAPETGGSEKGACMNRRPITSITITKRRWQMASSGRTSCWRSIEEAHRPICGGSSWTAAPVRRMEIDWSFKVGDQVKIRLVNEMESDHPMHHPFHVHGERFLVLARNGVGESNLVWKDTVLIRTGETVDILMDASNPGLWMAHCHIAEHMEGGMMLNFQVHPASG
jgi:hypothetical protein